VRLASSIRERLAAIVGPAHVLDSPADQIAYRSDGTALLAHPSVAVVFV